MPLRPMRTRAASTRFVLYVPSQIVLQPFFLPFYPSQRINSSAASTVAVEEAVATLSQPIDQYYRRLRLARSIAFSSSSRLIS